MPKKEPGRLCTRTKVVGLKVIMNMIYFHKLKKNKGKQNSLQIFLRRIYFLKLRHLKIRVVVGKIPSSCPCEEACNRKTL